MKIKPKHTYIYKYICIVLNNFSNVSFLSQNFYKTELNKEEMYIRYIHKLYDLHLKAQNYTGENEARHVFFFFQHSYSRLSQLFKEQLQSYPGVT